MSVSDTSIEAYHDHRHSGAFSRQQRQLLAAMHAGNDYSRTELEQLTGIRLSSICGAVADLLELGALIRMPPRPCKVTGRRINPVARAGGQPHTS